MNTPQSSPQSSEDTADDRLRERIKELAYLYNIDGIIELVASYLAEQEAAMLERLSVKRYYNIDHWVIPVEAVEAELLRLQKGQHGSPGIK